MPEISAKPRAELGKKTKSLRREGVLPAVLYGESVESTPLSVAAKEFEKVLAEAGETSLVTLKLENGKTHNVLIHDVAKDPLTLKPIHADFYAVKMDKPIEAKVPLAFTGESSAVKNEGGILVKVLHELEVIALPKDLPHEIGIDISRLAAIGDRVLIRDIALPHGVSAHVPADKVVILVEPPRSEAELEELEKPVAEEAVAEVKTEREVKAETEEAKAVPEEGNAAVGS